MAENEVLGRYFDLQLVTWPISNLNISRGVHFQTDSYVILNQRDTSFPMVYNMTHFGEQNVFFLPYVTSSSHKGSRKGEKNILFAKMGHIIYRWKTSITLIQNHIRTRLWKWTPREIFRFQIGHVTNCKSKYLQRTSFSTPGSYVIPNPRNTSFPTIYITWPPLEKKIFFSYYDVRRFWKYWKMLAHGP